MIARLLVFWALLGCALLTLWSGMAHAGSATLTWNKGPEADIAGTKVYLREEGSGYGAPMSTIAGKDLVTALVNVPDKPVARTVYFSITFYDTSGNESGKSNEVSKLFAGSVVHQPMVAPVLTTTAQPDTSITITWPAGPDGLGGEAKIDVRMALAPLSWGSAISTTCAVSPCTITGLTPGTPHEFQAIFYYGVMNQGAVFGPMGAPLAVSTKTTLSLPPTGPLPPTGLTVTQDTIDHVTVVAQAVDCPNVTTSTIRQFTVECVR